MESGQEPHEPWFGNVTVGSSGRGPSSVSPAVTGPFPPAIRGIMRGGSKAKGMAGGPRVCARRDQ